MKKMLSLVSGALCVAAILAACGGGGSAPGAVVSESPAKPVAVGLSVVKMPTVAGGRMIGNHFGDALPRAEIEVDVTGDLTALTGKQVYVLVNDPNGIFNMAVLMQDSSTRYRLTLYYESAKYGATDFDMPVGDFKASVQVSVCLDAKCTQPFTGSPILMPYTYKVEPGLSVQGFGPGLAPYALSSTPSVAVVRDVAVTLPLRTVSWFIEDNGGSGGVRFSAGASTLRIEGKAVAAGSHYGNFIVHATATTPSGATAKFLTSGTVSYEVK
jgi:hypothetical protein